ncbi:MAG: serine hydrolase [Streptosporangiaceae bacterium]
MAGAALTELFARAGCRGWLCVREVDGDGEVACGADELVVTASVFKVAVALEVFRQASAGRLDPRERLRVGPRGRTPGPTGLSVFADEAELSVRDLVTMMLTVSDNAATDVLVDRVGLDRLHATLAGLGLPRTIIPFPLRDELDVIGRDAGFGGWAELERAGAGMAAGEEQRVQQLMLRSGALDPAQSIRSTPRETATLLRLIWLDEAGPADACAPVRQAMARQVTRQRLALGFPRHGVQVAAKSGTLLGLIRNEAGVITMPDGRRYAAAVFTRADRQWDREHEINAAIGAATALAVGRLAGAGADGLG